jgi:hypothetical protein
MEALSAALPEHDSLQDLQAWRRRAQALLGVPLLLCDCGVHIRGCTSDAVPHTACISGSVIITSTLLQSYTFMLPSVVLNTRLAVGLAACYGITGYLL